MGLYSRYTAAFLTLILLSSSASAAVRQSVKPSAKSVIENALSVDYQTPNGNIHYYGREQYYALDTSLNAQTGSKIGPTIRPVTSTVGIPSFPNGAGALMNVSPIVAVKPGKVVPTSRIISGAKNLLRLTPGAVASTIIFGTLLDTAGWAFDELSGQLTKNTLTPSDYDPQFVHWYGNNASGVEIRDSSPSGVCSKIQLNSGYAVPGTTPSSVQMSSASQGICTYYFKAYADRDETSLTTVLNRRGTDCPAGFNFDPATGVCSSFTPTAVSNSDIDQLDLAGKNLDFYTGLMREVCTASSSPDNCYQEMVESSSLSGPATVAGPSSSSTSTSLNPDGSTTTTTTTTSTQHDLSYGPDHFDVGTKETKTTEVDGVPTETTITEDTTAPTESPPEEAEEAYTFDDTALPEVEPFYEPQYPDGFQGVWDAATADLGASAFVEFLNSFVPSFSGSCPSFSLNLNIASWAAFGTMEFSSLCYVFDFIKIIMLITALFTSRMIMFGG